MRIVIQVDDATGQMQIGVDPPNSPPPIVSWVLRKAEAVVFDPPPIADQPRVQAAPAGALRKLPGMNGNP